jgi:hypothetical protein
VTCGGLAILPVPGAQGPKGDTGAPGPFPDVLPSGKTLTGVYSVTGVASGTNQYFDSPIAFGFRFSSAPTLVTVGITDTAEEAAAAGCPGTAADPQAAPGKVCIYEMGRENTAAGVVCGGSKRGRRRTGAGQRLRPSDRHCRHRDEVRHHR